MADSPYIGLPAKRSSSHPPPSIASALAHVQEAVARMSLAVTYPHGRGADAAHINSRRLHTVKNILQMRDERDKLLGGDLFFDPAWNMLLDAYVNDLEGRKLIVNDVCVASRVPSTTAIRWLNLLVERELVVRHADPVDRRRSFVEITEKARVIVEKLVDDTTRFMAENC